MKASPSLLLDTSVLLHLVNAKAPGKAIEAQFGLRSLDYQPLICSVTLGEMEAFARSRTWGASKRRAFAEVRSDLVVVDIGNQSVYDVYADFSTLARSNGWGNLWSEERFVDRCGDSRHRRTAADDGSRFLAVA